MVLDSEVRFLNLAEAHRELATELNNAWQRVFESGVFIAGPELERFESDFADYCQTTHAIGVANGLDALTLILKALQIGPGDEVIVPSFTFIATWLAVSAVGATPVAAEPTHGRLNASLETVAPVVTDRTRAIMPVHLTGEPVDIEPILDFAGARNIAVIEDAAQAHGARRNDRRCGAFGLAAGFSFYPSKNLGALGDGGCITTNSPLLAETLRKLRNYGGNRKYEHDLQGCNSRLDELQAALLGVKLRKLDVWNARRRDVAARYAERLAGIENLTLPSSLIANEAVWHLYVVRTPLRNRLAEHMREHGIGCLIHYPKPPYRYPPYAHLAPGQSSDADRLCDSVLSLPIGPHMQALEIDRVTDVVRSFFAAT